MDLKSFIATTLSQVVDGVLAAQKASAGSKVAAEVFHVPVGHNLFSAGTRGMFTVVDFDVSVLAETRDGGSTVRVAGVEHTGDSSKIEQSSSRIKFSVHVKLPTGELATDKNAASGSRYDEMGDEVGWRTC